MAEIIRFPNSGRIPAASIPRAEFERLAELALDVVDQIVALLEDAEASSVGHSGDAVTSRKALPLSWTTDSECQSGQE